MKEENRFSRVIIVDRESKVLAIRQTIGDKKHFCFPGGKVEIGERPQAAAAREIFEELGIQKKQRELRPLFRKTFLFSQKEWIGHFYITSSDRVNPTLLEYPKIDRADFFSIKEILTLEGDEASFLDVIRTRREEISRFSS